MPALSEFPPEVCASRQHPDLFYRRVPDLYAEPDGDPALDPKRKPVMKLEAERLSVYRGAPGASMANALAVYVLDGLIAVPTGRVLVRFREGIRAHTFEAALRQLGYVIDEVIVYAPNAAWVRDAHGNVARALCNLDKLCQLSGVENVEPQFITARAKR
ncbi:MAG: hypothetical protein NZL91_05780 [Thermoflexales bacterium]|nr:hypothetical protein [Thermoflexales bacterium]